jgi:pyruvate/2-oxoglutarate dehydrogenase complex dihydrolipoamide acyltransferase (E2) component
VASTRQQPVVRDGKIVVRQIMKITLSCATTASWTARSAQRKFINGNQKKFEDIELWKRLTA